MQVVILSMRDKLYWGGGQRKQSIFTISCDTYNPIPVGKERRVQHNKVRLFAQQASVQSTTRITKATDVKHAQAKNFCASFWARNHTGKGFIHLWPSLLRTIMLDTFSYCISRQGFML